jgi:hypothetical protein
MKHIEVSRDIVTAPQSFPAGIWMSDRFKKRLIEEGEK